MAHKSAVSIVMQYTNGRMSARPEYYCGYGNSLSNLDSQLLEWVYGGVKKEIGDAAAAEFVNMVNCITARDDASATTFLNALYRLESNGWVNPETPPATGADAIVEAAANARKKGETAAVQVGLAFMMAGGGRGNTPAIAVSGQFLRSHADEIKGESAADKKGNPYDMFGNRHRRP